MAERQQQQHVDFPVTPNAINKVCTIRANRGVYIHAHPGDIAKGVEYHISLIDLRLDQLEKKEQPAPFELEVFEFRFNEKKEEILKENLIVPLAGNETKTIDIAPCEPATFRVFLRGFSEIAYCQDILIRVEKEFTR